MGLSFKGHRHWPEWNLQTKGRVSKYQHQQQGEKEMITGVRSLRGKSFLDMTGCSTAELQGLLKCASQLKSLHKTEGTSIGRPLEGKSVAMLFEKKSTRTRISTESGLALLGGHGLFLSPNDIHLGEGETIPDSGKVLARLVDCVFARVNAHQTLLDLQSDVPVINALSELHHPLQALADVLTLQETFGDDLAGRTLAWVGDGNNIIHSLMIIAPHFGINVNVATPGGYEPDANVLQFARQLNDTSKTTLQLTADPQEACAGADVIVTDTWISMGEEEQREQKLRDFKGYQVTKQMASGAAPDWKFMHCLPRKPYEVDDDVFYDEKRSLVWDEAENRKWTVMSVLLSLLQ